MIAPVPPAPRLIDIQLKPNLPLDVAEAVAERVRQGEAVLWIMNTVGAAQACHRAAKAAVVEGDVVGLLHSRFPAWRREELEEEWMTRLGKRAARTGGVVLVATQVVEQSVDIDADFLITELCPTDMLLQRMGRLWRHVRSDRTTAVPTTWIVASDLSAATSAPDFKRRLGDTAYVYSPYVLWRSHEVWHRRSSLTLPDETRTVLESTYTDPAPDDPPWMSELFKEFQNQRRKLGELAMASTDGGLPVLHDDEDARTRYDTAPTVSVLLVRQADCTRRRCTLTLADNTELTLQDDRLTYPIARAIHRNLVALRRNRRFLLLKNSLPRGLTAAAGDIDCVLRIAEDGRLIHLDSTPSNLNYDDRVGVSLLPVDHQQNEEDAYDHEFDW